MNEILCSLTESTCTNNQGRQINSVVLKCSKCGHYTESWGDSDTSIERALLMMAKECPFEERNKYVLD